MLTLAAAPEPEPVRAVKETAKAATKRALLAGLRNGRLEKAVEKMEADTAATATAPSVTMGIYTSVGHAAVTPTLDIADDEDDVVRVLSAGARVEALEAGRCGVTGAERVRVVDGWLSLQSQSGRTLLTLESELKPKPEPDPQPTVGGTDNSAPQLVRCHGLWLARAISR